MHTLTAAPPAAWTPADLGARLAFWHDASMGVTLEGGGVAQWDDLSGKGRHATQAVTSGRPTVDATGINGMPALAFDGSNDGLATVAPWAGSTARSVFAVWRAIGTGPYQVYWCGDNTPTSDRFVLSSANTSDPRLLVGSQFLQSAVARDGAPMLAEGSYNGTTGRLAKNNGSYFTLANAVDTAPDAFIGIGFGGTGSFNGRIAAILGIAGLATTEEVALIREYFRARYSLW